jgi:malic enzyme
MNLVGVNPCCPCHPQHIEELLPLVYTPTIGDACLHWGALFPRPEGLYISLRDKGRVDEVVAHWPASDVKIAVITGVLAVITGVLAVITGGLAGITGVIAVITGVIAVITGGIVVSTGVIL